MDEYIESETIKNLFLSAYIPRLCPSALLQLLCTYQVKVSVHAEPLQLF